MMRCIGIYCLVLAANTAAAAIAPPSVPASAASSETLAGPLEAEVLEVVDGDSIRVLVHIWLGQRLETLVRIRGIDAPEIRGRCATERALASAARSELERLIAGGPVILSRIAEDKYAGRILADARLREGISLAAAMHTSGLARPYDGGPRGAWCDQPGKTGESVLFSVR